MKLDPESASRVFHLITQSTDAPARDLRVVAAACLLGDVIYSLPPPARHSAVLQWIARRDLDIPPMEGTGFLLSNGQFANRRAAAALALRKVSGAPGLRPLANLWLVLLAVQVTLGASSVWTAKAVWATAAHLAAGGLLWITGVLASVLLARLSALSTAPARAAAGAGETAPAAA